MRASATGSEEERRDVKTMLERMAAAIDRTRASSDSMTMAMAVAEAMREPTDAMREAWEDGLHEQTADGDWNVMIDAILDEKAHRLAMIGAVLDDRPHRQAVIASSLEERPGRGRASDSHA